MTQVIQPANILFEKLADKQPAFTGKGRMMRYVILLPVDQGILLFNAMTCELILTDEEFLTSDTLREKWFVVPEGFDERSFVSQLRPIYDCMSHKDGITSYTILTTTDCNARCFYCYEKGVSRISMTQETAARIASFIIKNAHLSPHAARLKWFGGEPLYNLQAIDRICTELRNANVPYRSSMTSNCYLFNPEIVERARSLWNLDYVQVTLDGTEDVYNRIKAYIPEYRDSEPSELQGSGVLSPYQRVMRNIQMLLDADIHVDVRMNIDKHNAQDLMLLAEELHKRFSGSHKLTAYSHVLFQRVTDPLANAMNDKLNEKLMEYGFLSISPLHTGMPRHSCMADNENAVVFTPTGETERCEHLTHADFTEREEDLELCKDCPYYPLCIRLKGCPEGTTCNEYIQNRHIKVIRQKMKKRFRETGQEASTLNSQPSPLNPHPSALNHQPSTLNSQPSTLNSQPSTIQVFPFLDEFVAIGLDKEIIHLNVIGKEIFEMYVSGKTHKQMVEALLEEYNATECEISKVIESFTVKLSQIVR